jgi:hypothetical protein
MEESPLNEQLVRTFRIKANLDHLEALNSVLFVIDRDELKEVAPLKATEICNDVIW